MVLGFLSGPAQARASAPLLNSRYKQANEFNNKMAGECQRTSPATRVSGAIDARDPLRRGVRPLR